LNTHARGRDLEEERTKMKKVVTGVAWVGVMPLLVGFGPGYGFRSGSVKVMTRNLYVGANIFRIMEANSQKEVPAEVTEILRIVQNNNPPERFEVVADEIARTRPHLIGLQEVYKIRTQSPGDFMMGNPLPAEDVLYDYLEILLAALSERAATSPTRSVPTRNIWMTRRPMLERGRKIPALTLSIRSGISDVFSVGR
jgi:hypothetical protein